LPTTLLPLLVGTETAWNSKVLAAQD